MKYQVTQELSKYTMAQVQIHLTSAPIKQISKLILNCTDTHDLKDHIEAIIYQPHFLL